MDIIAIVEKLDSFGYIRKNRIIGDYYSIYCPFHNDGHERRASFGILIRDQVRNGRVYPAGFSHCFTCNYHKNIIDFVTDVLNQNRDSKSAVDWLTENIPGFSYDESDFEYLVPRDMVKQINANFAVEMLKSFEAPKDYVSEEELAGYRFTVPYMYERGLTDELIDKFDIGVDMNYVPPGRKRKVPCVTFPVRDINGKVLTIVRRSIKGKAFYLPANISKPLYGIYEFPKNSKRVMIVESCFNALTSWKYGIPAIALLGTGTALQIKQLKSLGVEEYILGLDPDDAGDRASNKLKSALKSTAIVRRLIDIPAGKDINDLTEDEFNSIIKTRR